MNEALKRYFDLQERTNTERHERVMSLIEGVNEKSKARNVTVINKIELINKTILEKHTKYDWYVGLMRWILIGAIPTIGGYIIYFSILVYKLKHP